MRLKLSSAPLSDYTYWNKVTIPKWAPDNFNLIPKLFFLSWDFHMPIEVYTCEVTACLILFATSGDCGLSRSSELDKFPTNIRPFPRRHGRTGHLQHRVTDKVPAPIPRGELVKSRPISDQIPADFPAPIPTGELVKSQPIFRSNPGRNPAQQPTFKAFPHFPTRCYANERQTA